MKQNQTSDESNWLPVLAIAQLLGLTPRRIQQLVRLGVIPVSRKGRYQLVPSVQGYCRYMQNLIAERTDTASAHTAEIQKQRAEKLKRENELAADQYIPRQDVIVGIQTAADYIRKMMLAIPEKAAPAALAAESVGDVKLVLQEAIHAALDEIARTRFVPAGEGDTPATKRSKQRRKYPEK